MTGEEPANAAGSGFDPRATAPAGSALPPRLREPHWWSGRRPLLDILAEMYGVVGDEARAALAHLAFEEEAYAAAYGEDLPDEAGAARARDLSPPPEGAHETPPAPSPQAAPAGDPALPRPGTPPAPPPAPRPRPVMLPGLAEQLAARDARSPGGRRSRR